MPYLLHFFFFCLVLSANCQPSHTSRFIASGHLPVIATDERGTLHLVYGQDSTIYYAVSNQQPTWTGQPAAVAVLPGLVAGAKRGPQLAVTDQYVVVTAINRVGDVFAYSLNRRTGKWSSAVRVNDVPEIAKEGFQAVAGAAAGTFHATWLDLRDDKRNKIMMATSHDGGRIWSANRVVYRSPSGTVCECCNVSIAAQGKDVYIQFRNWLNGSRDLYLAHSADNGATFTPAQKLGSGTWKLNACPMDGGAVVLPPTGQPITVWRRENTLYTCRPDEPEQAVAIGRNVTATAGPAGTALAWDEGGTIRVKLNEAEPVVLGKGQQPSIALSNKSIVCVWEVDGNVRMAMISQ